MSDLKIKLFSILNSIGPSMSAQQSEDISEAFNELDRLRAEVASLKEQLQNVDVLASSLHHDKESLTQQLAAAMRRVERLVAAATPVLRNELDKVEVHPCDYNDDAARARQCTAEVQELLAALTALPQQVKSEDAMGERAKADRDAMLYGQGFMVGGKHVPLQDILIIPPSISAQENKS